MSLGKLAIGILGGVAAGALLGVLFAPEEGSKTRKKISDKGNDFVGEIKRKLDDSYKNMTNHKEDFLNDAKEFASNKK